MILTRAADRDLTDNMGRRITYLRISVTRSCNLRCGYCYGSQGPVGRDGRSLSDGEVVRAIRGFAILGINKIRFTGGEPLLRKGMPEIIKTVSCLPSISTVGLTTNGILLSKYLRPLIDAGLNRLNVSLDTLDREKFKSITGADGFERVYRAVMDAVDSGAFGRVNINTVIMRGINDMEISGFAEWALSRQIELRFIEFMPILRSGRRANLFVAENEIKRRIGLDLSEDDSGRNSGGPAITYRHGGNPGRIGFISARSRCFCGDCNRLRLTSSGNVLGCLFGKNGIDLKKLLSGPAGADEIAGYVRSKIMMPGFRRKPGDNSIGNTKPFMRGIGG